MKRVTPKHKELIKRYLRILRVELKKPARRKS
jgi:hypothetical protein